MNWELTAGVVLTLGGLVGYAIGVVVVYEGRAFAVTAVMVGIALLAMGNSGSPT